MKSQLRPGTRVEVPAKPSLIATRMKRGTIVPMPANWHFPAPHWQRSGPEEGQEDGELPNQGTMRLAGLIIRSDLRSKDGAGGRSSSCLSGGPCL